MKNKEKIDESNEKEIRKKLGPYWKAYLKLSSEYSNKINELQKKMNSELNLDINLEFFWVDGECVGIGASDYSDRKKFPLIQDFDE